MTRNLIVAATLTAAFALAGGCDRSPTAEQAREAQDQTQRDVDALKDSAAQGASDVGGEAQRAADQAAQRASDMASDAAKAVQDQAESLYKKAQEMINEKRWAEAESIVDQLEALKDRLPAEWQARVEQVRRTLNESRPS